jgi:hypothetical protein
MLTRIRVTLVAVLLCVLAVPVLNAAIENPVVDFGLGYSKEGTRAANDHTATAGDALKIYGVVVDFNDPFADLNANGALEYSYVITGLTVAANTTVTPAGQFTFYDTDYSGGRFEVYEDATPDASFGNEASFTDGTLIIRGDFGDFATHTESNFFTGNCAGNQSGGFQFTGGSLYSRVSDSGTGFTGSTIGSYGICAQNVPDTQEGEGYFGFSNSRVDTNPPTPVEVMSWGAIKGIVGN